MILSNFHTHTVLCDGKDSAEELVLRAIELGCSEIGFSGHSYTPFDKSCCMSEEGICEYKSIIRGLSKKYDGKIRILLGIEEDYYSNTDTRDFDFVIGSVHYVLKDGEYLPVDESYEKQIKSVEKYYGGDFYAFASDYYKLVGELYEKTKCNIIGHFDLISKYNENDAVFDSKNSQYLKSAFDAIEKLSKAPVVFEVNTGAISRGYRKTAYPDGIFLSKMAEGGRPFLLSSDCHAKENLLFGLDAERERLEKSGYSVCLSSKGFL